MTQLIGRKAQQAYNLLHTGGFIAFIERYGDTMAASDALNTWHDQGKVKIRHTPTGFTVQTFKKYATNDLEVREPCGKLLDAHSGHVWEDEGSPRWCRGYA